MLSRNREWCNKNIHNVTIYKTLKWTERTTLKLLLATETLIWLNIIGKGEGVCSDATITTSIWLVNRKIFVNDTLNLRGTENYYLENVQLFCWKLLSYSLTALEKQSQFWSMSHLVSENKSIEIADISFW